MAQNGLTLLPPGIGGLVHLQRLQLTGNCLLDLPGELINLVALKGLDLDGNPLSDELMASCKAGPDALRGYLRNRR